MTPEQSQFFAKLAVLDQQQPHAIAKLRERLASKPPKSADRVRLEQRLRELNHQSLSRGRG